MVGEPPVRFSESPAGTVNVPGTVDAVSVNRVRAGAGLVMTTLVPFVDSVADGPFSSPAVRASVPPVTPRVRFADTGMGPVLVKLGDVPDCVLDRVPPLTLIVPLFVCAALALFSVSAYGSDTVPWLASCVVRMRVPLEPATVAIVPVEEFVSVG